MRWSLACRRVVQQARLRKTRARHEGSSARRFPLSLAQRPPPTISLSSLSTMANASIAAAAATSAAAAAVASPNLWDEILDSVSGRKATSRKNLIVLGECARVPVAGLACA